MPYGQAGVQLNNCALALQALTQLNHHLPVSEQQIRQGISAAQVLGRCQVVQEQPLIVLDVSHNEASVSRLAEFVKNKYNLEGRIVAVCGMLADKEVKLSLTQVSPMISEWFVANVNNERGASAAEIRQEIIKLSERPVHCFNFVEHAYENAKTSLTEHDCLLVFGSFHIAGDILAYIDKASA